MKIEIKKLADLKAAPYNPRTTNKKQENDLKASLVKFGTVEPIVFNKQTGYIVGGHFRVRKLQELGYTETECVIVDLSEADEKELNIRLNANTGSFDWDSLANNWDTEKLADWGLDIPGFDATEVLEAKEDSFDTTPPKVAITVLGDLYEIGEHRLLCGDSTCSDTVAKLMNGDKADMVFTDPPYLMDFKGNVSWDKKNGTLPAFNAKHGSILNDKMTTKEGEDFLDGVNANIQLFCKGAFYITFYRLAIDKYFESLNRVGLQCRSLIIWNKLNHTLSNSDYMSRYEPIFYGWVNEHNFYGGNNGMDIWDIARTKKNELHPTMKPIELMNKALNNSSKINDNVLDLFLGSGSTMVASHQLKRKCYGMELDCKYVDVCVKRMLKLDNTLKIKRNGEDVTDIFMKEME